MANTTNYNWETPDDTDLVKDGAAAIRTLGSAIDTTVFNNASAAIAKSIIDAKADLITATAADTPARLAVGADGTYLQADSSTATGLKWGTVSAGGMTELASGSLSGSSLSLTSISGSYKNLVLSLRAISTSANAFMRMTFNSISSGYGSIYQVTDSGGYLDGFSANVSNIGLQAADSYNMSSAYTDNSFYINIFDYASTNTKKGNYVGFWNSSTNAEIFANGSFFSGDSSAAITSVTITLSTGTFDNGTYVLWGVS